MRVWVLSVPPNVIGVYSSEDKANDAQADLDDATFSRCDIWVCEVDGKEIEEE